jgi:CO/xanthine dehydrogenase Mo-binding subunit
MNISQIHEQKIAGKSIFTDDICPENLIYGYTIRSQIPRGKILSVSIPEFPEGYFTAGAANIPGKNRIHIFERKIPFLAGKQVNYIGEPVLLIGGPDYSTLVELAHAITIDYKEATPVFSPEEGKDENTCKTITYSKGNVENLITSEHTVINDKYCTGCQEHLYLEPQCAVAIWDDQSLIIHVSTRYPFHVRDSIANMLGLTNKKIRVIVPGVSDPFEGKIFFPTLIAGHAALLSFISKKPVKIIYTRFEDISYSFKRPSSIISYTSVIDEEGKLLGMKADIIFDTGAYNIISNSILQAAVSSVFGHYACDHLALRARFISTNKVPAGGFSGSGEPQTAFAIELHTSHIARMVQMDPYIWKKKNIKLPREMNLKQKNKAIYPPSLAVLDEVIKISDFLRKYGAYEAMNKLRTKQPHMDTPLRGIGISLCSRNTNLPKQKMQQYSVIVRLQKNKKVKIFTSLVDPDGSKKYYLATIASQAMNISPSDITFETIDTSIVPDSGPTMYSQTVFIIGNAIEQCCLVMNKKKGKVPLPIEVKKKIVVPHAGKQTNGKEIDNVCSPGAWEATVVEVEIDPVSYMTHCRGIWIVIHVGHIVIPEIAREQVEAAALQNLGFASMEVLDFKNGMVYQNRISDYTIPGIEDLPEIVVTFLEDHSEKKQEEALDLGDQAVTGVAPSYIAAIIQTTGVNFSKIPLIPETIQEFMEEM